MGNLTLGGTGKTPVTMALVDLLKARGYTCGVVSRGYKRITKGVRTVERAPTAPSDFGDEATLIKETFPDLPVVVGERRVQAAKTLLASNKVQFILCDDGFQHRALKRDINLLLFDATEPVKNYRTVPLGRAREKLGPALRRADYFVVTKTNLANDDQLKDLIFWIKGRSDKPVLLSKFSCDGLRSPGGALSPNLKDPAYMVSGVAKPEFLEATVADKVKIVKHKMFPDHHKYTNVEVEAILDEASRLQARWIVTTAKDAVKLHRFSNLLDRLWIIDLTLKFEGDLDLFYANIDRLAVDSD